MFCSEYIFFLFHHLLPAWLSYSSHWVPLRSDRGRVKVPSGHSSWLVPVDGSLFIKFGEVFLTRARRSLWVLKPKVRWSVESLATGRRDIVGIGIIYQRWSKGMMRSGPSLTLLEESVDWTAHLSSHRRLSIVFRLPSGLAEQLLLFLTISWVLEYNALNNMPKLQAV